MPNQPAQAEENRPRGDAEDVTADIDTALGPMLSARSDLADRIGKLAAIAVARVIRREVPAAARVDLAWTYEGDEAFLELVGTPYDADGGEIPLPDRAGLYKLLLPYSSLLDETNTGAWADVVTECDDNGVPHGEDIRRLDVNAALALPAPLALPSLPDWISLLETVALEPGRPVTPEEGERLGRAVGYSTIPEALGDVLFAICGAADDEDEDEDDG